MEKNNIHIVNRRASFEYHLVQKYTAGIVLTGTEIKSIRDGSVNITDAFCYIKDGELFIRNMHISIWKQGSYYNHDPLRVRKLLLKRSELKKIKTKAVEKGFTIIATKMFLSESGYAKIEIAVAQGKKTFDKREDIKKRDISRDTARALA
ncbi:MAG: SsrA-binding protein SmpB [Bacteroidia bacterium]|nr:SsrA-binding protein SmpB [Bacteroidia bacterium]MBP9690370.1 SsrA-binding protein SmpB [Bacteroidia bacterium]